MALAENSLNDALVATEICSEEGDVKICSSVETTIGGGYKVTTVLTFQEEFIVRPENTRVELLKLSEEDREVIRVREIRYDATPGSGGVMQFEDVVSISAGNYDFEEIVTVSLQTEPDSYLRPKAPKCILITPGM